MDVITGIRKERGKMRVTLNMEQDILVPISLFRERPLAEGQALDVEEYDQWLLVRQYRHALDRSSGLLNGPCPQPQGAGESASAMRVSSRDGGNGALQAGTGASAERRGLCAAMGRGTQRAHDGKRRIAQELQRKGVSREVAESALEEVDEEADEAACLRLAEKLSTRYAKDDPRKARQKLMQALVRRGFTWDAARTAAEKVLGEE